MAPSATEMFEQIRACVFDAYGTLFDVHSAVRRLERDVGDKAGSLSRLWRQKQLEYSWLRTLMGRHADFWRVTRDALDYAMAAHGLEDAGLRERLTGAYLELEAYQEVAAVLDALRASERKTAILSNGSPEMLHSAVAHSGLDASFDAVLSVEDVQVFKPDPRVYRMAGERLGVGSSEVCFLSSNAWDVAGAATFGLTTVWVNRFGQPRERLPGTAAAEIRDLTGLPPLLGIAP